MSFFGKKNKTFIPSTALRCWYKRFTFSFIIKLIFTIILTSVIVINGITIIIEELFSPQFLGSLFCTTINVLFYFKTLTF